MPSRKGLGERFPETARAARRFCAWEIKLLQNSSTWHRFVCCQLLVADFAAVAFIKRAAVGGACLPHHSLLLRKYLPKTLRCQVFSFHLLLLDNRFQFLPGCDVAHSTTFSRRRRTSSRDSCKKPWKWKMPASRRSSSSSKPGRFLWALQQEHSKRTVSRTLASPSPH